MPQPEPFRLRLMKAVTEALEQITPANGYQHDMSKYQDSAGRTCNRVFRGRMVFGDNDPRPMLVVLEDPRPGDTLNGGGAPSGRAQNTFRILVQGFVADDPNHPLDPAYALSAEAVRALVVAKQSPTGLLSLTRRQTMPCIMSMSIGQAVHRPGKDEQSEFGYFVFGVTFILMEDLENPFA